MFARKLLTEDEMRAKIKAQAEMLGSVAAWARQHNVTATHVHDVINGKRGLGEKMQKALGVERVIHYRKAPRP